MERKTWKKAGNWTEEAGVTENWIDPEEGESLCLQSPKRGKKGEKRKCLLGGKKALTQKYRPSVGRGMNRLEGRGGKKTGQEVKGEGGEESRKKLKESKKTGLGRGKSKNKRHGGEHGNMWPGQWGNCAPPNEGGKSKLGTPCFRTDRV